MIQKLFKIHRGQKGITGLETAIILIAFVVVAAVFAYTALSAGLFSTQKSSEAVYSGLKEVQSTLELRGSVIAYQGDAVIDSTVGKVEFTVNNVLHGTPIDLTPPYILSTGNLTASGLSNPTIISYIDENVTVAECAWTIDWVGYHSDDYLLEEREKAVITVWLHSYDGAAWSDGAAGTFLATNDVDVNQTFNLEMKPPAGAVLPIERTTPARLDAVMDLH